MTKWTTIFGMIALLGCESSADGLKRHTGFLEIAPYTAGKNTRMVTVHRADGERVVIEVHYDKKYLEFVNKRVVVCGGPPPPPDDSRAQAAMYFKISEIALAPGEQPWDPPPERVPAPPVVTSRKDIDALKGAWGLAVGKPAFVFAPPLVQKSEGYTLNRVDITLADGTKLSHSPYRWVHKSKLGDYTKADNATILFQTSQGKKIHTQKSCLGKDPRCGVED